MTSKFKFSPNFRLDGVTVKNASKAFSELCSIYQGWSRVYLCVS